MDKFGERCEAACRKCKQVSSQLDEIITQVQTLTPRFATVDEACKSRPRGADRYQALSPDQAKATKPDGQIPAPGPISVDLPPRTLHAACSPVSTVQSCAPPRPILLIVFQLGGTLWLEDARKCGILPMAQARSAKAHAGSAGILDYNGRPCRCIDLSELALGHAAAQRISTR